MTKLFRIVIILLVVSKIPVLSWFLTIWVGMLLFSNIGIFIKSLEANPNSFSALATKRYVVENVYQDVKDHLFSVYAYSPAIYTFDYDYLFSWFGLKKFQHKPEGNISKSEFVYLIIPKTSTEITNDFINYRTPQKQYKTTKTWTIEDGTMLLKRERI